MSIENVHLITLLQLFNLNTLINSPVTNNTFQPALITFLTNQKSLFKFSKTFETGLSDHHKIISISIKSGSFKHPPKKTKKDLQVL